MFRQSFTTISRSTVVSSRALHSSPVAAKTVTEKVAEVADKANKALGKGLAGAIDKGENAASATKETLDSAKEKGSEATETAKGKANEVYEQGSPKANELYGQAKEKTNQFSAEAKDKADKAASGAQKAKDDIKSEVKK